MVVERETCLKGPEVEVVEPPPPKSGRRGSVNVSLLNKLEGAWRDGENRAWTIVSEKKHAFLRRPDGSSKQFSLRVKNGMVSLEGVNLVSVDSQQAVWDDGTLWTTCSHTHQRSLTPPPDPPGSPPKLSSHFAPPLPAAPVVEVQGTGPEPLSPRSSSHCSALTSPAFADLYHDESLPDPPKATKVVRETVFPVLMSSEERLGAEVRDVQGMMVIERVDSKGAFSRAGIPGGTVLVSVDDHPITSERDLQDVLKAIKDRDAASMVINVKVVPLIGFTAAGGAVDSAASQLAATLSMIADLLNGISYGQLSAALNACASLCLALPSQSEVKGVEVGKAAKSSKPVCVVCGRNDREMEERRSGFKCKACVGKHAPSNRKAGLVTPEFKKEYTEFVQGVVRRVRGLAKGHVMVLPVLAPKRIWKKGGPSEDAECALLVLSADDEEKYSMGVVSMRESALRYHPQYPDCEPPMISAGENLVRMPLVFSAIPGATITNSFFWYCVYRPYLYPSMSASLGYLYNILLPFLSRTPPLSGALTEDTRGWWARLPVGGDTSFALTCLAAVRYGLQCAGLTAADAEWVAEVSLRATVLDIKGPVTYDESVRLAIAAKCVAKHAAKCQGDQEEVLEAIKRKPALTAMQTGAGKASLPNATPAFGPQSLPEGGAFAFPLFGSFLRDLNTDALAGEKAAPRILIPAALADLPEHISTTDDAVVVLKRSIDVLTLLANQSDQLHHSTQIRFAFISHLICRVIPMPLHVNHPKRLTDCFWQSRPLKYASQVTLLKLLHVLSRHFCAVACALRTDRETDGCRVLVSAGIAALTDVLCRIQACDTASHFSQHYSGRAPGPVKPYGIDVSEIAQQTDYLLLCIPELMGLRTLVLDYFLQQRKELDADHLLFSFEDGPRMGEGDLALVSQLCLSCGIRNFGGIHATRLLTGERPDLLEVCEELAILRDVTFLLRMLLAPSIEDMPACNSEWTSSDAKLTWEADKMAMKVHGFGKNLGGACAKPPPAEERSMGVLKKIVQKVGDVFKGRKTPRNLSMANPSVLAGGERIDTEDDVLFITKLPDFDDALRPSESELLLTILTAPYLRIPLILGFFCERERIHCLVEPSIQAVIDACLFEPAAFQEHTVPHTPTHIPAPTREHLATSAGLLFNELHIAPQVTSRALDILLEYALEKDSGSLDSPNLPLILYVFRLVVRVEGFCLFACRHAEAHEGMVSRPMAPMRCGVRGLVDTTEDSSYHALKEAARHFREQLNGPVFRALTRWCRKAIAKRDIKAGVLCYTHLALIFRNIPPEEYDFTSVGTVLSAQVFLNNFHRFKHDDTSIPELEIFDIFELHRRPMWQWLREHDDGKVPEGIVRVATLTGDIFKTLVPNVPAQPTRTWVTPPHLPGTLIPDTHTIDPSWLNPLPGETYISWLLRTTEGPDTVMLNMNSGEFSLRKQELKLLPLEIFKFDDFNDLFREEGDIHCADVAVTSRRHWMRMVGRRHDLYHWTADDRPQPKPTGKKWTPTSAGWVTDVLGPVVEANAVLQGMDLYIVYASSTSPYAKLEGYHEKEKQIKEVVVWRSPAVVHVFDVLEHGRRYYRSQRFTTDTVWSFHSPHFGSAPSDAVTPQRISPANFEATLWAGSPSHADASQPSLVITRTISRAQGTQTYIPYRLIRGLLPDGLVEQYDFWQNHADLSLAGTLKPSRKTHGIQATRITVEVCRQPSGGDAYGRVWRVAMLHGIDDPSKPVLQLMNLMDPRMRYLADVFVRIENLSHILAWGTAQGALACVELPRLHLTFECRDGVLHCNQHAGMYISTKATHLPPCAAALQCGVPLTNNSHELFVLVSSAAEPIHPSQPSPAALGTCVISVSSANTGVAMGTEGEVVGVGRCAGTVSVKFLTGQVCDCLLEVDVKMSSRNRTLPPTKPLPPPKRCTTMSAVEHYAGVDHFSKGQAPDQMAGVHMKSSLTRSLNQSPQHHLLYRRGEPGWMTSLKDVKYYVYPVHTSREFIFTPTQASAMYLALILALCHDYKQLVGLLPCLSETIDREESQLWGRLTLALHTSPHSDAIPCRLRLSLAMAALPMEVPWSTKDELLTYLQRRPFVHSMVALSLEDELALLQSCGVDHPRNKVIPAVLGTPTQDIPCIYTNAPVVPHYDTILDETCFAFVKADWGERATASVSYTRPEGWLQGADALHFVDIMLEKGVQVMAVYELLTGSLRMSVDDDDDKATAGLLARHLADAGKKSSVVGLLRVMDLNRKALPSFPKFTIDAKKKESVAAMVQSVLSEAFDVVKRLRPNLALRPDTVGPHPAPTTLPVPIEPTDLRWLSVPFTSKGGQQSTTMAAVHPKGTSLAYPLQDLATGAISYATDTTKPSTFLVSALSALKTDKVAERFKTRLIEDTKLYLSKAKDKRNASLITDLVGLGKLRTALEERRYTDTAAMQMVQESMLKKANNQNTQYELARRAGVIPTLGMSHLVKAFTSSEREGVLRRISFNPSNESVWAGVALWLFLSVRIGQTTRCLEALHILTKQLEDNPGDALAVQLKAGDVVSHLGAQRHYVREGGDFDPHLLAFECLSNIMLREGQVALLRKFLGTVHEGKSMCHQMLMGQGKTTVIVPLLALILADGARLILACMPRALVDFSRTVLREKFNNPILPKPILTFDFKRITVPTKAILRKVEAAVDQRAVLVANPSAVKSVLLKLMELMEKLDSDRLLHEAERLEREGRSRLARIKDKVFGGHDSKTLGVQMTQTLREQVTITKRLLSLFQGGIMLMDEVDLLLHP
eukprot:Sspe_Gene.21874::Locus_8242_Transcript_1_1_Confidence_1.000_Length_8457::g.21874::m.21874